MRAVWGRWIRSFALRVVITGGAGFIGHHLASHLLDRGHDVIIVDDFRTNPLASPLGRILACSVSDITPRDIEGVDVVYHLAADKSVPESFVRPFDFIENVNSAAHLLSVARMVETPRVIIASTCEVYGVASVIPTAENTHLAPRSPYAQSKAAMEYVARVFQAESSAINTTIIRLFNIYGPAERPDAVVPSFCRRVIQGDPLIIEGDGSQRRDFTYVSHAVDILAKIAALATPVPVINVGSGISYSINELVEHIRKIVPDLQTDYVQERLNEIQDYRADTDLLRQMVAIEEPSEDAVTEGLRATLDWWSRSHCC